MVKYSLDIDYAENGAMALLKCQSCGKRWARVFENPSDDIHKDSFASWRKPIMIEHDLEHKNKVRKHG
jgi:hypothetical protein